MSSADFDSLETTVAQDGAGAALDRLAEQLRAERKWHEWFDARLMQARHRLGLPVGEGRSLDELPEPTRTQAGEAYREACREVGEFFLADGRIREAWMYLRPAGAADRMRAALETLSPATADGDALIEVALHEGVHVSRGYQWFLEQQGTCSAITAFESLVRRCPLSEQRAAAALLIQHLHGDLLANVQSEIAAREGQSPAETTLLPLIEGREWLFAGGLYHTDTTHLAAVMRIGRLIVDPAPIGLALDLAEYGQRLDERYQFPGEEPFVEIYPTHRLFFAALLGQHVEEALAHFQNRAEELAESGDPLPAEVYIYLLSRLGRHELALHAAMQLLPLEVRTTGFAPSLWELSRAAGDFGPLVELCRQRGDLAGFTAAVIESRKASQ